MLAVIRLRGSARIRRDVKETLNMLGLKRKHTLSVLPRTDAILGMVKKVESTVAWGDIDEAMAGSLGGKIVHLKPPVKGFRAIKKPYPKGDIGYRGKEISELIKRMLVK